MKPKMLTNKQKNTVIICGVFIYYGRNGGIRTHDPYHPKVVHYQAVLRPGVVYYNHLQTII